jgi:AcrR family transcriptional regulator
MPRPRTTLLPQTREQLLLAARRHFFARGYAATSMDAVAAEAGMSKKTVYALVPNKEALLLEAFTAFAAEMQQLQRGVLRDPKLAFPQRFAALTGNVLLKLRELHPRLFHEIQEQAPEVYAKLQAMRSRIAQENLTELFRQGQEKGYVRGDLDPAVTACACFSMCQALMQPGVLDRFSLAPHQAAEIAFDLMMNGYLTPKGRRVAPTRKAA